MGITAAVKNIMAQTTYKRKSLYWAVAPEGDSSNGGGGGKTWQPTVRAGNWEKHIFNQKTNQSAC